MCWLTADTIFVASGVCKAGQAGRKPRCRSPGGARALGRQCSQRSAAGPLSGTLQARQVGRTLAKLMMPPAMVVSLAFLMARVWSPARARARWVVRAPNHNATMLQCYNALPMLGGCLKCSSLHLGEPVPDSIKALVHYTQS